MIVRCGFLQNFSQFIRLEIDTRAGVFKHAFAAELAHVLSNDLPRSADIAGKKLVG